MSVLCRVGLFLALVVATCDFAIAAEPNETSSEATRLGSGVRSVSDNLTPGFIQAGPDTYLGTLGWFGDVEFEDDDDSEYGDGFASGLSGIPINPGGTIDFLVTGCCDDFFVGDHAYSGDYEVIIEVFDFFGDPVEDFSEIRTMVPGVVEEFHYFGDETWLEGSYNINIDNQIGDEVGGDVDYYTFTDLDPGSAFSAEITQVFPDGFDSILGWFDESGALIDYNDDKNDMTYLSFLEGTVPANGELTFAVTGYDDFDFIGGHLADATYSLELTTIPDEIGGDFDNDGDIDGRDFLRWQRGGSPNPRSAGDLAAWQTHYGTGGLIAATLAVPEPGTIWLFAFVFASSGLAPRSMRR